MLKLKLNTILKSIQGIYQDLTKEEPTLEDKFKTLILELSKKNKIALLIDEYDLPIISHIEDIKTAKKIQKILKNFYGILKGMDDYLRTIVITGVTKFAKTSLFTGLNNLIDLTVNSQGATILGYTEEEIKHNFKEHIQDFAYKKNISEMEILSTMKDWYNGYQFSKLPIKVYTPFSVLYYLKEQDCQNYWLESGTPTLLVHLLKTKYSSLNELEDAQLSPSGLGSFEINNIPLIPLLFQTGYLTIENYSEETKTFTLIYPNKEVSESFKKYLVVALTHADESTVESLSVRLKKALENNNVDIFCQTLQSLFAHIPYHLHISQEKYYHSLFQFLGTLLNIDMQSEISTDKGRIDVIINMKNRIYVMELKFDENAIKALKQIEDRKYFERFLHQGKKITLVGITFGRKNKRLDLGYKAKDLS